jgi:hypothetical protein
VCVCVCVRVCVTTLCVCVCTQLCGFEIFPQDTGTCTLFPIEVKVELMDDVAFRAAHQAAGFDVSQKRTAFVMWQPDETIPRLA